jgi:flavin-dependent dehydrogenase
MVFDKPLTISQISFDHKQVVSNHILMCGDSAGMIHPLAGNGMSMAIRAAEMTSELILQAVSGTISTRAELEQRYKKMWDQEFKARLNAGHTISKLFKITILTDILISSMKIFPFLLPLIIKQTHGRRNIDQ